MQAVERIIRVVVDDATAHRDTPVDVTLSGHSGSTARDLIGAGVESGLWPAPHEPWIATAVYTGRSVEPDEPLRMLGLVHGDLLRISIPAGTLAGDQAPGVIPGDHLQVHVLAGPDAGHRRALGTQPLLIGREPGSGGLRIADPSLSGTHVRLDPVDGRWIVTDVESRNGSALDGVVIAPGASFPMEPGQELEIGRSVLALRPSEAPEERRHPNEHGELALNRPPRMVPAPLEAQLEPPEVPDRPRGPRLPLITALLPLIGGIVLWRLTDQVMMLAFTLLSPLMMFGSYASDKASGRADLKAAKGTFLGRMDDAERAFKEQLAAERAARLARYPDAADVLRRIDETGRSLWERRPSHLDHLTLRIGLADQPAQLRVPRAREGGQNDRTDPELRGVRDARLPEESILVDVPMVLPLQEATVIGVVGPAQERAALMRWITVQLAALHSPRDVQLAAALDADTAREWDWMKWLPHVRDSAVTQLGAAPLATSTLEVSQLLEAFGAILRERAETAKDPAGRVQRVGPDLVLIVEDSAIHDRAAAGEILAQAPGTGVHVIWEAAERDQLPGECRWIVELDAARARATATDTVTRTVIDDISLDGLAMGLTERAAAALAPVKDVTQADRGIGALPPIAHLAELEHLTEATGPIVAGRWSAEQSRAGFTLGAGPEGPLVLDLVEHGPHALVGGTPGSGKSELLRGVLTSLALRHPPERMTFLLVDFKGGAAFREFAALPHTVGIVTDLDEHLAERALTSFRAEIKYREALLDRHGAIDVIDLARRAPDVILPRLLIVIDEFATLAQEVPAFVDGVIDVTQRGRSLGVHLVLATQSPRGSVTGKIRANTNLAIGLRTVSADESIDILGTKDAAAIPVARKGRAWARVGESELVPFQSGYVGAASLGRDRESTSLAPFRLGADRGPGPVSGGATAGNGAHTQSDLDVIAAAILDAFAESGAEPPRPPWLQELPERLSAGRPGLIDVPGAFGLLDDPARQRQEAVSYLPERDGSLIVLGAPRSGKTSTLAMIAATLARQRPLDELHLYGLDCGGRALGAIEALPHCGSVVPGDDQERTVQFLAVLGRTLQARRDLATATGAADLEQLRSCSDEPLPRVIVLLDDIGGFTERYDRVEAGRPVDELRALIADGPAFGLHFVIAADRRAAIPTSVASAIPKRLIHRLSDRDEYSRVGLSMKLADAVLPPGRAFTDEGSELQVVTAADDPDETLRATLERLGEAIERTLPKGARRPAPIATLAPLVHRAEGPAAQDLNPWQAFLGIQEANLGPVVLDLEHANFVVAGSYRSGRSTALAAIATGLLATTPGLEAHLLAPRRSRATERAEWTQVHTDGEGPVAAELFRTLLERAEDGTPVLLAIDDATEVDTAGIAGLDALLRRARDVPMRIVIGAESQSLRTSYAAWHVQMRKDGYGIALNANLELDGDLFGVRFPWRRQITFPDGRGMFVNGSGAYDVVQVVGD